MGIYIYIYIRFIRIHWSLMIKLIFHEQSFTNFPILPIWVAFG